mgnify:CR=1 FL=1
MKQYFSFKGTAKKQEFWAITLLAALLGFILGSAALIGSSDASMIQIGILFNAILVIMLLWLNLATASRRCRDAGISPFWVILYLVPYLGVIALIVFGSLKSIDSEVSKDTESG